LTLSFRDVEDLLAERGVTVSYEAIRYWCLKFGPTYARTLRRKQGRLGDIWHVDELFITIQGQRLYLWRAVDQDGNVINILVTNRSDRRTPSCPKTGTATKFKSRDGFDRNCGPAHDPRLAKPLPSCLSASTPKARGQFLFFGKGYSRA
jgi:hypothetical protein